jgi:hypothetical protein
MAARQLDIAKAPGRRFPRLRRGPSGRARTAFVIGQAEGLTGGARRKEEEYGRARHSDFGYLARDRLS